MQFVNGPLAWITTAAIVLSESAVIIAAIAKTFIVSDALVDTFDLVLVSEKQANLVQAGRKLETTSGGGLALGRLLKRPFAKFTPEAIVKYLMWLPLNFIPVVGTVLFIIIQGKPLVSQILPRLFLI